MSEKDFKPKYEKIFMMTFAGIITTFAFVYWACITFLPVANQRFADTLNGSLMTLVMIVIGYWFTASSSSDKKTDIIKSMSDKQNGNENTK